MTTRKVYTYEIIWESGHVERVEASLITYNNSDRAKADSYVPEVVSFQRIENGHWVLVLRARGEDIRSVRNVSYASDSLEEGD